LGSNEDVDSYDEILDIKGLEVTGLDIKGLEINVLEVSDDPDDSDMYSCGRDAVPAPEVSLNIIFHITNKQFL
jgi:hypothetical protein